MKSQADRHRRLEPKAERKRRREEKRRRGVGADGLAARAGTLQAGTAHVEKMSAVLREFAEPLLSLQADLPLATVRDIFALACVAWNAEVVAPCGRGEDEAVLERAISSCLPPERVQATRDLVAGMRQRKREHFAADRRFVGVVDVIHEGDSWRVLAASTRLD